MTEPLQMPSSSVTITTASSPLSTCPLRMAGERRDSFSPKLQPAVTTATKTTTSPAIRTPPRSATAGPSAAPRSRSRKEPAVDRRANRVVCETTSLACGGHSPYAPPGGSIYMPRETHPQLIAEFLAAWNSQDVERVL